MSFLCTMTAHTLQLNPPLPVVTQHGEGWALFFTDYGLMENAVFTVATRKTGSIRHYNSSQVRLSPNHTFGINLTKKAK